MIFLLPYHLWTTCNCIWDTQSQKYIGRVNSTQLEPNNILIFLFKPVNIV